MFISLLFLFFVGLKAYNDVVLDHDGGIIDVISVLLNFLVRSENIKGITITPAHSFAQPAVWATAQLQRLFRPDEVDDIPYGFTIREGINLFPYELRNDSNKIAALPFWANNKTLNKTDLKRTPSSIATFRKVLNATAVKDYSIDVVATGPLNSVADIIIVFPELQKKIRRVYVYGGAISVRGNIQEKGKDGTAELNVFCDPMSWDYCLKSGLNLTIIPLDATKFVPITKDFRQKMREAASKGPQYRLVNDLLELIAHRQSSTFWWDVLTSMASIDPTLIKTEKMYLRVEQKGASEGRTIKVAKPTDKDIPVEVANWADLPRLEQMIWDILAGTYKPKDEPKDAAPEKKQPGEL